MGLQATVNILANIATRKYSGHKSCFLPHPHGQGYLFSSPIFRARACELMLSMTKIGAKRRKFRAFSSQKLLNGLNWEEIRENWEETWEIWEIKP